MLCPQALPQGLLLAPCLPWPPLVPRALVPHDAVAQATVPLAQTSGQCLPSKVVSLCCLPSPVATLHWAKVIFFLKRKCYANLLKTRSHLLTPEKKAPNSLAWPLTWDPSLRPPPSRGHGLLADPRQ